MADPKETKKDEQVTLTTQQYAALLERLEELERVAEEAPAQARDKKGKKKDDTDDLLDELYDDDEEDLPKGKARGKEAERQPASWDSMTNSQLVPSLINHIIEGLQPLFVQVEELRLYREMDSMEKAGYDVSPENMQRVLGKMKGRNGLTMQEAYHDVIGKPDPDKKKGEESEKEEVAVPAKGKETDKVKKETDKSDSDKERRSVLRHLPPIPGERPGASGSNFDDAPPKTIDDAIEKAMQDVAADFEL